MTGKRRAIGAGVVLAAAVIAACLGPHLSTTEQQAVVVSEAVLDFGTIEINLKSAARTITVSPASGSADSDDTVMSISVPCTDFKVTGPLPRDVFRHCGSAMGTDAEPALVCTTMTVQTADYMVTFEPIVAGSASCTMQIIGTFGSLPVTLIGTGAAPAFAIQVAPQIVGFGDVRRNMPSDPIAVKVTNIGSQPLPITSVAVTQQPAGGMFAVAGNVGSHVLPVGAFETFPVTCTPTTTTNLAGTLTVASSATNGMTMNVPLSCRGTDSALRPSPSPVDLDTRVGEPVEKVVTITNLGGANANITAFTVSGHPELSLPMSPPPPLNLGSGSSTMVRVRYGADTAQAKTALGKLTITHDGGSNDEVILSAEALATSISVNPDTVDFGPVCAGGSATQDVQVFANAAGSFVLNSVAAPAAPFTFTAKAGTMIPSTAGGGHKNTLEFTAKVMPGAEGSLASVAMLATDIPRAAPRPVALRAEALPPGISATPRQLDFGAIQSDTTTPARSVKLTNCGTSALMVTGAHLEGANANDFAIVSPANPAGSVAPSASMELLVVMTPRSAGAKMATLVVEHSGGASTSDLLGTALGIGDNDGDRRDSYYNCSAGGASGRTRGAWPVGLALAALLRRRRRRRS